MNYAILLRSPGEKEGEENLVEKKSPFAKKGGTKKLEKKESAKSTAPVEVPPDRGPRGEGQGWNK